MKNRRPSAIQTVADKILKQREITASIPRINYTISSYFPWHPKIRYTHTQHAPTHVQVKKTTRQIILSGDLKKITQSTLALGSTKVHM